jgi:hypothetical protein
MLSNSDLNSLANLGGNIAELVKEVQELREKKNTTAPTVPPESPLRVGNNVFIRTVTHHYTGHIVKLTDIEVVLIEAAWIADDGRFSTMLQKGTPTEVEPYISPVAIGRGAILDTTDWTHELPKVQK